MYWPTRIGNVRRIWGGLLFLIVLGLPACEGITDAGEASRSSDEPIELFGQGPADEILALRYLETEGVAADDFRVPVGQRWSLSSVQLQGEANARSLRIRFYTDDNGQPGALFAELPDLAYAETVVREGVNLYLVTLPLRLELPEGEYWLGVHYAQGNEFLWREFDSRFGLPLLMSSDGSSWYGPGDMTDGRCCDLSFRLFGSLLPR